jgi:hypothetical protein
MLHRMIIAAVALAAVAISVAAKTPVVTETLADVLQRELPEAAAPPANLQSPITSYAVFNDPSFFVIGYYEVNAHDPNGLERPLRVLLLDKRTGLWRHREIKGKTNSIEEPENICAGSVLQIKPVGNWLFLGTHLTPSASCTFVLSRTLEVNHILFGWPMAFFSSGAAIMEGNTVHFSPIQPLSVEFYDPATGGATPLLPRQDDTIYRDFLRRVSSRLDKSWCREHHRLCEVSETNGELGKIAVNDQTNTAALLVDYDDGEEGYGAEAKSPVEFVEVIYVFDLSRKEMRYREFQPDVLKKMVGEFTLENLTQPATLQRIFPESPAPFR